MSQKDTTIHEAVREHYGAIARSARESRYQADPGLPLAAASCCGADTTSRAAASRAAVSSDASCGCSPKLYDDQLLKGLPVDVTGLSLGCGDPVTIAGLNPGETVLDLGSGGGIDCFLAARQVGPSGYVIGVDMTPDMLERANANKAKLGVTNVEFRQGQIEALPVADNSVDVIMSNCVINLSPDKAAVFQEAFRVLKPGGRVSISDIVTEGEFSPELRAQLDQWAGCVTGAIDVGAYTGLMRQAGFVELEIVDKVEAGEVISVQEGTPLPSVEPLDGRIVISMQAGMPLPHIYSARITARKPR
jgi:arsenite methyltransferase